MIRSEQDGRVRRITLAAPETRNVLTSAGAAAFLAELADAEHDEGTGSILVDSEGQMFCAGLDFADPPEDGVFTFGQRISKPVVASMKGVALSAGVALLSNTHIVIAAQGSSFGLTDIREGRWHAELQDAVKRVLGDRRMKELSLTGRIFTTPDALQWGLVHAVVPAFELEDRVLAVAQGLAGAKREAVRGILGWI